MWHLFYLYWRMKQGIAHGGLPFPGTDCPVPDVANIYLTHRGPVDLRKWAILTPYWCHQSLGYLKKIWIPVVNIQWCPWTFKGLNI